MLITEFVHIRPKGHEEPHNEVGSLSPPECLAGFEPGTFQFLLQRLNPLGHSPQKSSQSTADLLTVVSDRIARAFNMSGATRAVALRSYGISGQIFDLNSSFLINRHLQVVLEGKSSQEYPFNA